MSTISDFYSVSKQKKKKTNQQKPKDDIPIKTEIKPRHHHLTDEEKLLRQFDQNYKFGPCKDITRLERWERAQKLKLHPPAIIKEIILSDETKYLNPFWTEHKILD